MTRSTSPWAERGRYAEWLACTVSKSRVVFRRVIRRPKMSTRRTVTPGKIGETPYHTPALRRGYRRLNSGLSRACISDMGNLASVYVGATSIGPREGLRKIRERRHRPIPGQRSASSTVPEPAALTPSGPAATIPRLAAEDHSLSGYPRSEERRVGKERRSRWGP